MEQLSQLQQYIKDKFPNLKVLQIESEAKIKTIEETEGYCSVDTFPKLKGLLIFYENNL